MELKTEERKNRFNGESIMLTKKEAIIHDRIFINEMEATLETKTQVLTVRQSFGTKYVKTLTTSGNTMPKHTWCYQINTNLSALVPQQRYQGAP